MMKHRLSPIVANYEDLITNALGTCWKKLKSRTGQSVSWSRSLPDGRLWVTYVYEVHPGTRNVYLTLTDANGKCIRTAHLPGYYPNPEDISATCWEWANGAPEVVEA